MTLPPCRVPWWPEPRGLKIISVGVWRRRSPAQRGWSCTHSCSHTPQREPWTQWIQGSVWLGNVSFRFSPNIVIFITEKVGPCYDNWTHSCYMLSCSRYNLLKVCQKWMLQWKIRLLQKPIWCRYQTYLGDIKMNCNFAFVMHHDQMMIQTPESSMI